ncbi:hypothetical protein LX32DRAFT_143037 [Colletotrichum zoysiae]|uniref:Uncharacterized protein n=1 Tax=Colletotrichum zoysiae TaxID=1216348 RepID=A0AAD9LZ08_9PEZI|nr:hypothetical protein LX32DRAFT_143037 [Colletotrichum zoysiae]
MDGYGLGCVCGKVNWRQTYVVVGLGRDMASRAQQDQSQPMLKESHLDSRGGGGGGSEQTAVASPGAGRGNDAVLVMKSMHSSSSSSASPSSDGPEFQFVRAWVCLVSARVSHSPPSDWHSLARAGSRARMSDERGNSRAGRFVQIAEGVTPNAPAHVVVSMRVRVGTKSRLVRTFKVIRTRPPHYERPPPRALCSLLLYVYIDAAPADMIRSGDERGEGFYQDLIA